MLIELVGEGDVRPLDVADPLAVHLGLGLVVGVGLGLGVGLGVVVEAGLGRVHRVIVGQAAGGHCGDERELVRGVDAWLGLG